MDDLLDTSRDLDNDVFRNIVSLRKSQDLFDDLTANDADLSAVAIAAEMRVKQQIPSGIIERGFHYSVAIGYPFEIEPAMASRYSDGSFPVWYGSLDLDTTVYETAYHMWRAELGVEGVDEVIYRERAVYKVYCRGLLIDLTGKQHRHPELIATKDYSITQQLGKRLAHEGHPGLLAPSVRKKNGINTVIFNEVILSNPRIFCYLQYALNPVTHMITVTRQKGCKTLKISFN